MPENHIDLNDAYPSLSSDVITTEEITYDRLRGLANAWRSRRADVLLRLQTDDGGDSLSNYRTGVVAVYDEAIRELTRILDTTPTAAAYRKRAQP